MSAKSSKPAKKLSVPRSLEEIQQEYSQLCANAGQTQYKITIETRSLAETNRRIEEINNEAAARNQLDREAAATKES